MKKFLSWVSVVFLLVFAMTVNSSSMDGSVNFFDLSKWSNPYFWIQLGANTIFLVSIYAAFLNSRLDSLFNPEIKVVNGKEEQVENEIDVLYTDIMAKKDKIVADGRKTDLDMYLKLVVSLDERIDTHKKKLEDKKRTLGKPIVRWRYFTTYKTYRSKQKDIEFELQQCTRYQIALKSDINELRTADFDPNTMTEKYKETNFDVLFDMVDYEKNQPIKVAYSVNKEVKKHIMKSPLSAFTTVLMALVAFSGTLYFNNDWRSVMAVIFTLVIAAAMKSRNGISDAEGIFKNKKRSLHKTKDELNSFETFNHDKIVILQDIFLQKKPKQIAAPVKEKVEEGNKDIAGYTDQETYGFDPMGLVAMSKKAHEKSLNLVKES